MYIENLFQHYGWLKQMAFRGFADNTIYARFTGQELHLHFAFPDTMTLGQIDNFKEKLSKDLNIPSNNLRLGMYNQRLFAVGRTPPQPLEALLADRLIYALTNGDLSFLHFIQAFADIDYKPICNYPNHLGNTPFTECLRGIGMRFSSNRQDIKFYMDFANWLQSKGAEFVIDNNNIHPIAKLLNALPISDSGRPIGREEAAPIRQQLADFLHNLIGRAQLNITDLVMQANAIQQQSGFLVAMDVVEKLSQGYPEIYNKLVLSQVRTRPMPSMSFVQRQSGPTGYDGYNAPSRYGDYDSPTGYSGPSNYSAYPGPGDYRGYTGSRGSGYY